MGIQERKVTTYTCDGCGHQTEEPLDRRACAQGGMRWRVGSADLPVPVMEDFWWCGECFFAVRALLRDRREAAGNEAP